METLPDPAVLIESELFRRLHRIGASHARPALASSLGAEDMVLLDAIARTGAAIDVFVIDTGRLHAETLRAARRRPGPLRPADRGLPAARGAGRGLRSPARPERLLRRRRRAPSLLRHPQGRAARPRARGPRCLAHRPAPRPGAGAGRAAARGDRPRPRHRQAQPARLLVRRGPARLHRAPRRAGQRPACPRLSVDRLRALHPRGAARARTRAPAAGGGSAARPRNAACTCRRSWSSRPPPDERAARTLRHPRHRRPLRSSRLARVGGDLHPARGRGAVRRSRRCCSPAARTAASCCAWRRRPSGRSASAFRCCTSTPATTFPR